MLNAAVRTCTPSPMVSLVGRQCGCLPLLCSECNTIRSVSTCWISPWYLLCRPKQEYLFTFCEGFLKLSVSLLLVLLKY